MKSKDLKKETKQDDFFFYGSKYIWNHAKLETALIHILTCLKWKKNQYTLKHTIYLLIFPRYTLTILHYSWKSLVQK
jgi:hypothetical protein